MGWPELGCASSRESWRGLDYFEVKMVLVLEVCARILEDLRLTKSARWTGQEEEISSRLQSRTGSERTKWENRAIRLPWKFWYKPGGEETTSVLVEKAAEKKAGSRGEGRRGGDC